MRNKKYIVFFAAFIFTVCLNKYKNYMNIFYFKTVIIGGPISSNHGHNNNISTALRKGLQKLKQTSMEYILYFSHVVFYF